MGTNGQTLSTVHLGGDRFLLLYNRRYGEQGIVAAVARLQSEHADGDDWLVDDEILLYDPGSRRHGRQRADGVSEMLDFEFGFPTATAPSRRDDPGDVLVGRRGAVRGAMGDRSRSIRERCSALSHLGIGSRWRAAVSRPRQDGRPTRAATRRCRRCRGRRRRAGRDRARATLAISATRLSASAATFMFMIDGTSACSIMRWRPVT